MINKIKEHIARVEAFATEKKEELEQFRIEYFGKKGLLNDFFAQFKEVPKEEKKEFSTKYYMKSECEGVTVTIERYNLDSNYEAAILKQVGETSEGMLYSIPNAKIIKMM